jgi:colanic acid/amylovoran biosynthesis glycosyltransferase
MRILIITSELSGSSEPFVKQLLLGLVCAGNQLSVAAKVIKTPFLQGGKPARLRVRKMRLLASNSRVASVLEVLVWTLYHLRRACKLIQFYRYSLLKNGLSIRAFGWLRKYLPFVDLEPEVTHFQFSWLASDYEDLFALLPGKKVVSCRGSDVAVFPHTQSGLTPRLRSSFELADRVHCVAEAIAKQAVRLGAPSHKIAVIPPAIEPHFLEPPIGTGSSRTSALRAISVGRLHWVKGLPDALIALVCLKRRGYTLHYTIVGDGPEERYLRYMIRELGLSEHVSMVGRCGKGQVIENLRNSDVLLLPSLSEGISNSAMEAMAVGLPIVASAVGGMPELVRDGVEGLLVPPGDPERIADAIELLAEDIQLRLEMGQAARKRVLEFADSDLQIRAFTALYSGNPV